jgi:hypothetical protein
MTLVITRLGSLLWVAYGAEVFNQIGKQIKGEVPTDHVIFSSLTNGCIGYLPTAEEHPLGGYEVDLAPFFYRLPARLQVSAEEIIRQKAKKQIRKFYPESRIKSP